MWQVWESTLQQPLKVMKNSLVLVLSHSATFLSVRNISVQCKISSFKQLFLIQFVIYSWVTLLILLVQTISVQLRKLLFAGCGILICLIGFLGCCGAMRHSTFMLLMVSKTPAFQCSKSMHVQCTLYEECMYNVHCMKYVCTLYIV